MYTAYHIAEGLSALIDAFIERRSYDSLLRQAVSGSLRGHRRSWHSTVPSNASVISRAQLDPKRLVHHCLRELSRLRRRKFAFAFANLTHLVQLSRLKLGSAALDFPRRACGYNGRNFKSTAPGSACAFAACSEGYFAAVLRMAPIAARRRSSAASPGCLSPKRLAAVRTASGRGVAPAFASWGAR
jgi:hypothetical protein